MMKVTFQNMIFADLMMKPTRIHRHYLPRNLRRAVALDHYHLRAAAHRRPAKSHDHAPAPVPSHVRTQALKAVRMVAAKVDGHALLVAVAADLAQDHLTDRIASVVARLDRAHVVDVLLGDGHTLAPSRAVERPSKVGTPLTIDVVSQTTNEPE